MAPKKNPLVLHVRFWALQKSWSGMVYEGEQNVYSPRIANSWQELFVDAHKAGYHVGFIVDIITGEEYTNA